MDLLSQCGERDKFLKRAAEENSPEQRLGFWENLMQIIYQTSAGVVMLTDIVFWCLLLPFMTDENFKLTVLIGLIHSANAIFLLDSVLSNLQFTWFGFICHTVELFIHCFAMESTHVLLILESTYCGAVHTLLFHRPRIKVLDSRASNKKATTSNQVASSQEYYRIYISCTRSYWKGTGTRTRTRA